LVISDDVSESLSREVCVDGAIDHHGHRSPERVLSGPLMPISARMLRQLRRTVFVAYGVVGP
jgi:hypothetical protein